MKHSIHAIIVIFLLLFIMPDQLHARYNPDWNWKTIQTDHFTIYYPEGYEPFAQRVLSLSEEVYADITTYLGVTPRRCPIVLNPGTDTFNGFYSPFPNRISFFETPLYSLRGFGPCSDIMDAVFTHEFAHYVHITTRLGWYGTLSNLLGTDSAITNIISPGWIIEGVTTNAETMFTDGGRGRSSLFRGEIMSFTEGEGMWNLSAAGTYPPYQPPSGRFYLSGYFMIEYLNRTYGDDAFARLGRYQAEHPLGGTREALKHVTGKNPGDFYTDFLHDFHQKADTVKQNASDLGLPSGKTLYSSELETLESHYWTQDNTIIALRTGYSKKNAFIEIDPASGSVISEINPGRINTIGPVRSMKDPVNIIFSGVYPHPLGYGDLDIADITVFNITSGSYERLTRNQHIFSADISPDTSRFVAARRNGMWIDLVLIDSDGTNVTPLISRPGIYFEAPEWSPDGSRIVTVVKSGQNSDIALVNPDSGELETLFETDVHEDSDPSFSPDGRWIVFSSGRSDIWNIYAWNLQKKTLHQLTSVNYAATDPRVSPDGKTLSFFSLRRGVNTLCTMPFEPETGKPVAVKTGSTVNPPNLNRLNPPPSFKSQGIPLTEAYKPYLHIPYYLSNGDEATAGLWVLGGDPVGKNSYSASVDYGMDSKHTGYDVSLVNRSFWPDLYSRVYSVADKMRYSNAGEFWIEERGADLGAGINVTHRVIPDFITSYLKGGSRYTRFNGLEELDFSSDFNESVSLYGELTLSRRPDAARRDMVPSWGQTLFTTYEKAAKDLGSEIPRQNAILSLTQYTPSVFDHHGFELKSVLQRQKGVFAYDKTLSIPRGYSDTDTEGGLYKDKNLLLSAEYHFPISFMDDGLGLSFIHFNAIKSSFFADWGAGWDGTFDRDEWTRQARTSLGGSLTSKTTILSLLQMEIGVEAGYKLKDEEGFMNLVLLFGF